MTKLLFGLLLGIVVLCAQSAPDNATYITQIPNAVLTAEQALSALVTGYLKNTTGTGVLTVQATPIPVADGGTGANMGATGGANQFLKQTSLGAAVTIGVISASNIAEIITLSQLSDVASKRGNSTMVQMASGAVATNDCAKFDPNGNLVTAGGACGLAAPNLNAMTDLGVQRTSTTVLTIGAYCSSSVPCNVRIGNTVYSITASATATITAGTGTAYIYMTDAGVLTVGHNVTVTCAGSATCTSSVTSFPATATPIYTWTSSSATWDSGGGSDKRAFLGVAPVAAGAGSSVSYASGIATVALNAATINSTTWGDGTLASFTWTFNLTGTDPVLTLASNALNITTGGFQESGNAVPNATDNLSFFAATTSAQLLGVLSDETGSGVAVFGTAPTITNPTIATGIAANGSGFKHQNVTTGSIALSSSAAVTLTWSTTFADASYTPVCSVLEATAGTNTLHVHHIESFTATAVVVRVVNDSGADARTGTLYCFAAHI